MNLIDVKYGYAENPGYLDLVVGIYKNVRWYYRFENWRNYSFPSDFYHDITDNYNFPIENALPIFYIALLFTIVRYLFESLIGKVYKLIKSGFNLNV